MNQRLQTNRTIPGSKISANDSDRTTIKQVDRVRLLNTVDSTVIRKCCELTSNCSHFVGVMILHCNIQPREPWSNFTDWIEPRVRRSGPRSTRIHNIRYRAVYSESSECNEYISAILFSFQAQSSENSQGRPSFDFLKLVITYSPPNRLRLVLSFQ